MIHICPWFWEVNLSVDISGHSMPGVIVHEYAHFVDVADADDNGYGLDAVRVYLHYICFERTTNLVQQYLESRTKRRQCCCE